MNEEFFDSFFNSEKTEPWNSDDELKAWTKRKRGSATDKLGNRLTRTEIETLKTATCLIKDHNFPIEKCSLTMDKEFFVDYKFTDNRVKPYLQLKWREENFDFLFDRIEPYHGAGSAENRPGRDYKGLPNYNYFVCRVPGKIKVLHNIAALDRVVSILDKEFEREGIAKGLDEELIRQLAEQAEEIKETREQRRRLPESSLKTPSPLIKSKALPGCEFCLKRDTGEDGHNHWKILYFIPEETFKSDEVWIFAYVDPYPDL